jgi:Uma2 family endonuclease
MSHVIYDTLSLKRFLRLPEAKPALEYFDGKVVQKVAPKRAHSIIQTMLTYHLQGALERLNIGDAYVELRCTWDGASLVPDICVFTKGREPPADDVCAPPDLMIEVLSHGQTVRAMSRRLIWCTTHGVRLGWLIQPRMKRAYVFRPCTPVAVLDEGGVLDGELVIPGFEIHIADVLAWLTPNRGRKRLS